MIFRATFSKWFYKLISLNEKRMGKAMAIQFDKTGLKDVLKDIRKEYGIFAKMFDKNRQKLINTLDEGNVAEYVGAVVQKNDGYCYVYSSRGLGSILYGRLKKYDFMYDIEWNGDEWQAIKLIQK